MLTTAVGSNGAPVPIVKLSGTTQQVAYTSVGGASAASSAFNAKTEAIMLTLTSTDADLRINFGAAPTASSTTDLIAKPGVYFFAVAPGQKIAVLSNSTTTGTVTFSELQGSG